MTSDTTRRIASRLAAAYAPDRHVGAVVKVFDADAATGTPAHWLAAAWAPAQAGPQRWPAAAALGSPDSQNALLELLERLPPQARLHLAPIDALDLGLAARIVLQCDRNLESYQRDGLERFIERWSGHERDAIRDRYTDRDEGFERFAGRLTDRGAG
ncbi:MAG TPA: hypothetical protein VM491_09950 [Burkholderiaceae bacterium]|nr:hypothetical protein [Burkholderiaceae bacterium]